MGADKNFGQVRRQEERACREEEGGRRRRWDAGPGWFTLSQAAEDSERVRGEAESPQSCTPQGYQQVILSNSNSNPVNCRKAWMKPSIDQSWSGSQGWGTGVWSLWAKVRNTSRTVRQSIATEWSQISLNNIKRDKLLLYLFLHNPAKDWNNIKQSFLLHLCFCRFHSFLLFLGYSRTMVRDIKAEDFCRTLSSFSLEYRSTRQAILLQRERERLKGGANSSCPNSPAARGKHQKNPTQVLISDPLKLHALQMLFKSDQFVLLILLSVDPSWKWGAAQAWGGAEDAWEQLKTGQYATSASQEAGRYPR